MASGTQVLAGWVEGDELVLELAIERHDHVEVVHREKLVASKSPGMAAAISGFLGRAGGEPVAGCVAVPGPVIDGRTASSALPWPVDERDLRALLGNIRVADQAAAAAAGIALLRRSDLQPLQTGTPSHRGTIAVAHVGSVYTFAVMLRDPSRFRVLQTAAGEAEFAPRGVIQRALATHLEKRGDRASLNRILAGRGLRTVLDFLAASMQPVGPDAALALARDESDPGVVIRLALEGRDDACAHALATWAAILGEEIGSAALRSLPTGGIYLSGELVGRTVRALRNGSFVRAFLDKGTMRPLLEQVPVYAVLEPRLPLIGAAHAAFLAAGGRWPV